ncbi:MAG: hypothetical protein GTO47_09975, partial [Gammaproteobacteria bacterium]|nr:hypothetical protein [Gammaproteobacteria bacterium]NIO25233.1 hypothetical protein [Gammaproteobacteria bacterium]NIT92217.1 hypothetical protein [Gammaproteobacteria bacterium]
AEIAEQGRAINDSASRQAEAASLAQHAWEALRMLDDPQLPEALDRYPDEALTRDADRSLLVLRQRYQEAIGSLSANSVKLLKDWPARKAAVQSETYSYTVRG